MKTFEEAFRILQIPIMEDGEPESLAAENFHNLGETVMESPEVAVYFAEIQQLLLQQYPEATAEQFAMSFASTVFVAGIRIGQEMEKAE